MLLFLYSLLFAVARLTHSPRALNLNISNHVICNQEFFAGSSLTKATSTISMNLHTKLMDGARWIFCLHTIKYCKTTVQPIHESKRLNPFTQVQPGSLQMAINMKASLQVLVISKFSFGKLAVIQQKKRVGLHTSLSLNSKYQNMDDVKLP